MPWVEKRSKEITRREVEQLLERAVEEARQRVAAKLKKVLLLPPDVTRMHSGAGWMTEYLYNLLNEEAEVQVIPTLGQHVPHTRKQNQQMFGSIPEKHIQAHDWREGVVEVGEVPAKFVKRVSGGKVDFPIPIWLNTRLMQGPWDLIINIGHVVPHEVLGFANHNKNYFIGLGGKPTICASHLAAATCGIENNVGNLLTPVRACFNQAEEKYLGKLPDMYVQVVLARNKTGKLVHTGFYAGNDWETYLSAAKQAREENITVLDKPLKKVVCLMQEDEFFSTWVANKAIYRTRMAIADGGELLIIAPGLKRFGEQPEVDAFIRKYGYVGTEKVMNLYHTNADMQDLAHATAHLIHGSSEGRFTICYAPGHLTKEEIKGVGFAYMNIKEALEKYPVGKLKVGFNNVEGEQVYFIPTPSAGLWATKEKLYAREKK